MEKEMIFQIGVFTKATITDVTFEWPGAIVHVHMGLEVSWGRE